MAKPSNNSKKPKRRRIHESMGRSPAKQPISLATLRDGMKCLSRYSGVEAETEFRDFPRTFVRSVPTSIRIQDQKFSTSQ